MAKAGRSAASIEGAAARPPSARHRGGADHRAVEAEAPGAAAAVLTLQRAIGNRATAQILLQRRGGEGGVVVEDAEEEDEVHAPPRSERPSAASTSSGPLLLADAPWAEVEKREALRRRGVTIEDATDDDDVRPPPPKLGAGPTTSTGPLLLADAPWAVVEERARKERDQREDPRYQHKLEELRTSGAPQQPLKPQTVRRRKRQLGKTLFDKGVLGGRARAGELAGLRRGGAVGGLRDQLAGEMAGDQLRQQQRAAAAEAQRLLDAQAKAGVEAKRAAIEEKYRRTQDKKVTGYGIDVSALKTLNQTKNSAVKAEKWTAVGDLLDQINDESAKILSYASSLDTSQARIDKLKPPHTPQKRKIELRIQLFGAFQREVIKSVRNDVVAMAALTALNDALQAEEDKVAADQAAVVLRAQQVLEGRWPACGRQAAVIATTTRAAVGANANERAAVVEALDALRNGTAHGWARKWGDYHGNGEGLLPGIAGGGGYKEYYVRPDGARVGQPGLEPPGAKRLVKSDSSGFVYYSHNHYGSPNGTSLPAFVKVNDA